MFLRGALAVMAAVLLGGCGGGGGGSSSDSSPPTGGVVTVEFAETGYSVNEDQGSVTVTVRLTETSSQTVTVDYLSDGGSATAGDDYADVSGTLEFQSGVVQRSFRIDLIDDSDVEGGETAEFILSNPSSSAVLGAARRTTVTIVDDDSPGTLQFEFGNYRVSEGVGVVSLNVLREGGSAGLASIECSTTDVTAQAPGDYTSIPGLTLTWASGETGVKRCDVPVQDDSALESTETLQVVLSNAVGASLGGRAIATVEILDNDSPGTLQFEAASYSVSEGVGSAELNVVREGGTAGTASVECMTMDGTAQAPGDYGFVTLTLSWASGEAGVKRCAVPVVDDSLVEGDEDLSLLLSNASGASLGIRSTATLEIRDNDSPPPSGGTSLGFVVNPSPPHEYGRQLGIAGGFGVADFTLQLWIKPDDSFPVGSTSVDPVSNWSDADNLPYSSGTWWFDGNFLLDGFNNATFSAGSFALQFYGGGRVRWLFGDGASVTGGVWSVGAYPATSAPSLLDGNWHRLSLVRRCTGVSGAALELWVDGGLIATETSDRCTDMRFWWNGWSGFPTNQAGWFWGAEKFAALGGTIYEDYKGLVDELRFWNRALSASEIVNGLGQSLSGSESGLAGLYRIDDGAGSDTCDSLNTSQCIDFFSAPAGFWVSEGAPLL